MDEIQGEILELEIKKIIQECTTRSAKKIFKDAASMLCDSESFRPDTLYQISCPSSETRNLALLRDILDGVLLKSETSENL